MPVFIQALIIAAAGIVATSTAAVLAQVWRKVRVLDAIVRQFATDSGSSLRDAVDRLEEAADKNAALIDALTASLRRIEAAAGVVAADLAASQERADDASGPEGAAADAASKSDPLTT